MLPPMGVQLGEYVFRSYREKRKIANLAWSSLFTLPTISQTWSMRRHDEFNLYINQSLFLELPPQWT